MSRGPQATDGLGPGRRLRLHSRRRDAVDDRPLRGRGGRVAWLSAAAPIVALLLVGKFILAPSLGPQRSPASRPVSMHAPFVQRLTDRVVARWPHDPTAFTQGLEVARRGRVPRGENARRRREQRAVAPREHGVVRRVARAARGRAHGRRGAGDGHAGGGVWRGSDGVERRAPGAELEGAPGLCVRPGSGERDGGADGDGVAMSTTPPTSVTARRIWTTPPTRQGTMSPAVTKGPGQGRRSAAAARRMRDAPQRRCRACARRRGRLRFAPRGARAGA